MLTTRMYYFCYCLPFHDAYTLAGIRADTPESEEDPGRHQSPPSEPPERSPEPVDQGRQRAAAAVQAMYPPSFLARISASVTTKTTNVINRRRRQKPVCGARRGPASWI